MKVSFAMLAAQTLVKMKMTARLIHGKKYVPLFLILAVGVYLGITAWTQHTVTHNAKFNDPDKTRMGERLFPRRAFVIALDERDGIRLRARINETLGVYPVIIKADKGVSHDSNVHIFTRYMMDTERVDHKLIGNAAMIGCLMSHVQIWKTLTEPAFIFEEDAVLDAETRIMIANQLYEANSHNWSALMLTQKWKLNIEDEIQNLSPLLATCKACNWGGTRAYIITPEGASVLLEYHLPLLVQVDGLMALVNTYDARFNMIWVRDETVKQTPNRPSSIQTKPCPKCYHVWDYADPRRW